MGVILFRKSASNKALFHDWHARYLAVLRVGFPRQGSDQTPFIEALLQSESRLYVMSNAWNARAIYYLVLNESVKIIHGRGCDYEGLRSRINQPIGHRCWDPVLRGCYSLPPDYTSA